MYFEFSNTEELSGKTFPHFRNMKKIIALIALFAVLWAAWYFFACTLVKIPDIPENQKAVFILEQTGCVLCHDKSAKPPFYASIPLVGSLVKSDMSEGLKSFDIGPTMKEIAEGKPVNETILAKIEHAVNAGTMPPFAFVAVHANRKMSADGREILMKWIASERGRLNKNSGVAKEFANEPVWPIPEKLEVEAEKAKLGQILYHHTALSGDNTVSCATCHPLEKGGVDGLQTSVGIRKQKGEINAPTVYNAAFNKRQFWNGRAADLAEQAGGPPMNPVEMDGVSWEEIAKRLSADAAFKKQFEAVYPDGFTGKNITDAIAQFEKTLITPNSPFDRYLRGDKSALTADQIRGYELFKLHNCAICHAGQNLGGQTFEYMGLKRNYFADRGNVGKIDDTGLKSFTNDERDMHKFKTPTLRNVALTAPYFHDGSTQSLKNAVSVMAKYQRGKTLSSNDIECIVKFLESLTGELEGKPLKKVQ